MAVDFTSSKDDPPVFTNKLRSALLEKHGFEEEEGEILRAQYGKTGFPKSEKHYTMMWEVFDLSLEEPYFWVLDVLKENFPIILKMEDSFAASENSAFFGVTQQRLGAQQDKVSQFLATVGKMIKELFQMVRELRIIDERLEFYRAAAQELTKEIGKRGTSAEITLKGYFVDLVQGGGKSAASVYGMARELEFITLQDLFFDAPPFKDRQELENHVKNLAGNFNKNVLRVLERHLAQFQSWKERTHKEHEDRRRFMLTYLKQHFEIIQMYVEWVKPYLRHAAGLSLKHKNMTSADLISSFEGSMLDIEVLAVREKATIKVKGIEVDKIYEGILATFNYRTRPEMKVVQEGYQRGPVHIGRMEMHLRVYQWSGEEINNYKKLKKDEALELVGQISESVQEAMKSLGTELTHYLEEANTLTMKEGKEESQEHKKEKKPFMEAFLFCALG